MSGERQELIRKRVTLSSTMNVATEADEPTTEPRTLEDFVGQQKVKDEVSIAIAAAKARGEGLGHILLRGPEGSGKRTLALVIAREMAVGTTVTSGSALERAGDLAAIITNLGQGDILFIDEVHRLSRVVEDRLCQAMKDRNLDIVIGKGPTAKTINLPLPQFTVLCATDQPDRVSHRLRELFEHVYDFEPYEVRSLVALVQRRAKVLGVKIDGEAALQIARAAGGRMREARRLLDRVREYAPVRANGAITTGVALDALASLGIEPPQRVTAAGPPMPDDRVSKDANLTWQEFEDFVAVLYQNLGYQNVTVTSRTGDEGKDLVMEFESPSGRAERVYVQCKQWGNVPVGRQEIQVLHSAVVADGAYEGIVVTTSRFTGEAVRYAKKVGNIQLIDGKKLRELTARAGLQTGTESPLEELTESAHDRQLEPAYGEQGAETVTGVGPATPPVAGEEEPPKLTEEVQALFACLDDLSTWARRMFERLDQVHEKEPMLSTEHAPASLRGKQYHREFRDAALGSLRSFRQVLDEAEQCLHGQQTRLDQWGLTNRRETSRLARQQQELADYSSRYQHLFDTAFETYLSLRHVAPHPSLSDCQRDALEGMYYGLSWALAPFVKYPAKEYEGKTVYITAEAPAELVRHYRKKYLELTESACGRLASVARGTASR
jgi:Holliday junction DNA helicase RuvB